MKAARSFSVRCLFFLATALAAGAATVGRWERFEVACSNPKPYTDSYRDVELDATFTRPDGRVVPFRGFHDGGSTWRLRFMPDQVGLWRFEARFSDGTPGASGQFECVASDLPGMIAIHAANPIWFGHRDGGATTLRALHVGDRFFARNWDDAGDDRDGNRRAAFLDWAQQQGYNTLSIASHYLNRSAPGRGEGWETPALWPLDAAAYRGLEAILDELARRRMLVYPFAGFFGRDSAFPRDPAEQTRYLRYTLARLAPYWNLLFNVGGPEPRLKQKPYLDVEEIHRLGAEIARSDPFGHPLSLHNPTGDDEFKDAPWLSYGTLQGPKTLDRRKLAEGVRRNHHPEKPLLAQETLWSGNTFHIRSNRADYTDADLRRHAYVILFSGANFVFADNDGDSSSGFTGTLDPAACKQSRHDIIKRVWDCFETLPYGRMRPRPDLVNAGYCLADPGSDYLVYLDQPASVEVRVEGGPYTVTWINARDARERSAAGLTSDGRGLRPPGDDDWLLWLRRTSTAAMPSPARTNSVFSLKADNTGTLLNGRPFLAVGLRLSNGLISDAKTAELIAHLDEFAGYGVNTISVFLQGSRFGHVRGYLEDGSLDPVYAARLGGIIEAADARGMVVLVGCLYHGTSQGWWPGWRQADAERAVANTVRWLRDHAYRNVFVDVNNEQMAKFDEAGLIAAGKAVDASYLIASSGKFTPSNADLSIHQGSRDLPGKYYIETEGTLDSGGEYWTRYSRQPGLDDYLNIGVYPEAMKREMIARTDSRLARGQGYLFASTWLQNPPPNGPHHTPGGSGTREDPGVRWWLEHLKTRVGPFGPTSSVP